MKKIVPDPPSRTYNHLDLELANQRIREALGKQPKGPLFADLKDTVEMSVNQHSLFSVKHGIKAEDALLHIALWLKCAEEVCDEISEQGSGIEPGLVWSVIHAVEMARAVLNALLEANHP